MKKLVLAIALTASLSACSQANTQAKPDLQSGNHEQAESAMELTNIGAKTAAKLLAQDKDIIILDIRTPAEFASGHIDGAINIDFKSPDFATKIDALDKTKQYMVHCRSGGRSGRSLPLFQQKGFKHIIHMKDGIIGWNKAGLPLIK